MITLGIIESLIYFILPQIEKTFIIIIVIFMDEEIRVVSREWEAVPCHPSPLTIELSYLLPFLPIISLLMFIHLRGALELPFN